jgi:hypothetical protein
MGPKNLRYLNVDTEYVTNFDLGFQANENFMKLFSGSYNELRDNPRWTDIVSFSNIGPFMQPPAETNYDIVVHNSVNPNVNLAWNMGQKELRYLNIWCDNEANSNLDF